MSQFSGRGVCIGFPGRSALNLARLLMLIMVIMPRTWSVSSTLPEREWILLNSRSITAHARKLRYRAKHDRSP